MPSSKAHKDKDKSPKGSKSSSSKSKPPGKKKSREKGRAATKERDSGSSYYQKYVIFLIGMKMSDALWFCRVLTIADPLCVLAQEIFPVNLSKRNSFFNTMPLFKPAYDPKVSERAVCTSSTCAIFLWRGCYSG